MAGRVVGDDLLDRAYRELEFAQGRLLHTSGQLNIDVALDSVGEWLTLAERMGAERVFFVEDDPVILFHRLPSAAGEADVLTAYRRAWSLARPHCLFLATPDDLRVYALSAPPARSVDEPQGPAPLEIVESSAHVAEALSRYHREKIESGALWDEEPYVSRDGRADTQLLHDVRTANDALIAAGLPATVAHALIERVILIRYLEDRSIVTREYFEDVARDSGPWGRVLDTAQDTPQLGAQSTFVACLHSTEFAYAVFECLESDFNGDLFRIEGEERESVEQRHLDLIYDLLTGTGIDPQMPLFLWAYDFGVVPISLISSMYEHFYHAGTDDLSGTHYTPPELVEFALRRMLTDETLDTSPRICDPACGSGIFLVEAFRCLVRHASRTKRRPLDPQELQELLLRRIAGIDINPAAIRLAAFSLYLAYLSYLDPSDIRRAGRLPRLIHGSTVEAGHGTLVEANTFAPTSDEYGLEGVTSLPWESNSFDVVVGNPPWSEPRGSIRQLADKWIRSNRFPVGDRNPSQQFLWRSLSLLKPGGLASLLVSATAFHNSRTTSQRFRSCWLEKVELEEVVDFTSARHLFFDGAVAPFMLTVFRLLGAEDVPSASGSLSYSVVRPSRSLAATRAPAHAHIERRWVDREDLVRREYLWKTYAWGNHHDDALMARLDFEQNLANFLPTDPAPGWGYQKGGIGRPSERLSSLRSLMRFDPWGPLDASSFESPPTRVKRQPDERRYDGQRIVIAQGIRSGFGPAARLETTPFSFRAIIYCLPLQTVPAWQAKTILGTLLSALGRYRLFMKSGSWGLWHDTILAKDILDLPIRMAGEQASVTEQISYAVDALKHIEEPLGPTSAHDTRVQINDSPVKQVLSELDEAVFDLFKVTTAERDLVRDFIDYTLPLVGSKTRWHEQSPVHIGNRRRGTASDLTASSASFQMDRYLSVFLQRWNRELEPDGEFSWYVAESPRAPFVAVVFETQKLGARTVDINDTEDTRWRAALEHLGRTLELPLTTSIRAAGTLRSVGDRSIVIAKRNEERLWTASAAREDAEATILQAMNLQSAS